MSKNLYSLSQAELLSDFSWNNYLLGVKEDGFFIEPRSPKSLSWFCKILRWFKGTFRLSTLHYKIDAKIQELFVKTDFESKRELEKWKIILPKFQTHVIDKHNQRAWFNFSKVENFSPLLEKINTMNKPVIPEANGYFAKAGTYSSNFNVSVYQKTCKAIQNGYRNSLGETVHIDQDSAKTISYEKLSPLPPPKNLYPTTFTTLNQDTYNAMIDFQKQGFHVVGNNLANLYHQGGGVERGAKAQEEDLCRRSNLKQALDKIPYPLPVLGGALSTNISYFRTDEKSGYTFMEHPVRVDVVSVAAYNLTCQMELSSLGLNSSSISANDLIANKLYMENTKEKIRQMLRSIKDYDTFVAGAIGCGAFANPPECICRCYEELFSEPEFKGRFKNVVFATLIVREKDQKNFDCFEEMCKRLNGKIGLL